MRLCAKLGSLHANWRYCPPLSKTYAKVIQLMIDYISFFRSCECIMPNSDISLDDKPKIMGEDWNPGNENMLQVGDDVNCDPGPCSSGRTPPINYLLQLCTLTKIKGRKFHTGKIASGRNYPTDRVLRYYLRVGGIFVRLKSPESHHGDTLFISSIAPENNKLSGKMQFKGKMMQFQFSFYILSYSTTDYGHPMKA